MDGAVPFGLPGATALYVTLYVVTLALHVGFMGYVLAGTGYLAGVSLLGRRAGPGSRAVAESLRSWLPFFLGAAITAGVAPLLFVQVLYQESFYTAQLLLVGRWMVVVPVLMVGFYLLYLGKTEARHRLGGRAGAVFAVVAFGCFGLTALAWTQNHLTSLLDRDGWVASFAAGEVAVAGPALALRLATWLLGAAPIMAVIAGWQLRYRARHDDLAPDAMSSASRSLAVVAAIGLAGSAVTGWLYGGAPITSGGPTAGALLHGMGRVYLGAVAAGMLVQGLAWAWQWRARQLSGRALAAASAGGVVAVLATALARESLRLAAASPIPPGDAHERASHHGGLVAFAVFLVLNGALIAWCLRTTVRGLRHHQSAE